MCLILSDCNKTNCLLKCRVFIFFYILQFIKILSKKNVFDGMKTFERSYSIQANVVQIVCLLPTFHQKKTIT